MRRTFCCPRWPVSWAAISLSTVCPSSMLAAWVCADMPGSFNVRTSETDGQIDIPVSCVTDMDVMPDCAPKIIGKTGEGDRWPEISRRRWKAKRDMGDKSALATRRNVKEAKASGQYVRTFVSDEWTLEYDLALGPRREDGTLSGGLAEDVYVSACIAERKDAISAGTTQVGEVEKAALEEFAALKANGGADGRLRSGGSARLEGLLKVPEGRCVEGHSRTVPGRTTAHQVPGH